MKDTHKATLWGAAGAGGLFLFYALLLSVLNSPSHAWQEFLRFWYWILLLVGGFGIQVGLFVYARQRAKDGAATASVAASGGMSGVSMAACCAHHLSEVLPLLGLTAASAFLIKYQLLFILAGVISTAIGIRMMLHVIQKHGFHEQDGILAMWVKHRALADAAATAVLLALVIFAIKGGI